MRTENDGRKKKLHLASALLWHDLSLSVTAVVVGMAFVEGLQPGLNFFKANMLNNKIQVCGGKRGLPPVLQNELKGSGISQINLDTTFIYL